MAETTKTTKSATPAAATAAAASAGAPAAAPVLETRSISRRDDTIEYEHAATRRAAWRDKVAEGFKTFLWVAPLTALIWIYAERAQIAPLEVRVPIKIISTSPDRLVTILSPGDRYVTLDLRAPRASLDAVRERVSTNARPIEVTIPEDIQPGFVGDISVTERIERNPLFQDWAVDVERSFPAVHIRVEKKVSRVLPIRVKPEDSGFANVTFDPPNITIEGPQSIIERIPAEQGVYTDLDKLRSLGPGTHPATVSVIGYDQAAALVARDGDLGVEGGRLLTVLWEQGEGAGRVAALPLFWFSHDAQSKTAFTLQSDFVEWLYTGNKSTRRAVKKGPVQATGLPARQRRSG